MIVYVAGHAYVDDENKVYLAPKNFSLQRMAATGLTLAWLVDLLEHCPTKEKLLLLDCCHEGTGADLKAEPSTEEMLRTLATTAGRSPLKTLTAITSCKTGQRGLDLPAKQQGLFAFCLADGYSGRADKNRDNHLEPTELYDYLLSGMAAAAKELGKEQAPVLILPDSSAPRLSPEAKVAIRKLAAFLRQDHIDITAAHAAYSEAQEAAGKELEPKLLAGLVFLKVNSRDTRKAADATFQPINATNTEEVLPPLALGWIHFQHQSYKAGVDTLADGGRADSRSEEPQRRISGDARSTSSAGSASFVSSQPRRRWPVREPVRPDDSFKALDAAIASRGDDAQRCYDEGGAKTQALVADFDQRISGAKAQSRRRWRPRFAFIAGNCRTTRSFPSTTCCRRFSPDWISSCSFCYGRPDSRPILLIHVRSAARVGPSTSSRSSSIAEGTRGRRRECRST